MEVLSNVFSFVPTWFLWVIITGITLLWYLTKKHDYWKEAGIPYVSAIPIMGSVAQLFSKPVHEVEIDRYKSKGRFYGTYEGSRPVLNIADPEILRDILVKDFQFFPNRRSFATGNNIVSKILTNLQGEDWKRVRTVLTPTFTTGKIKRTLGIFIDSAKTLMDNFKKAAKENKPVDMKPLFGAFSMDVIASAAFATKIDSHNDPQNQFVANARRIFINPFPWRSILFFTMPKVLKLFKISVFPKGVIEFFEEATLKIVEERKRSGARRNDFLQLMIDAVKDELEKDDESVEKDAAIEMGHDENNDKEFKFTSSSKHLTNDELVAQCVIFFVAGYDTVASTLGFTCYELALNPEIQDKLIKEIDETISEKGGLTHEAIAEMKYLHKVISETLRKYPPAIRFDRIVEEDYHLKKHNITLPKGMLVGIPVYALHHDPEYYPDPEKYDPERFSPEQKATRDPYVYLPFGAGPRNCVGMRFALTEAKVCLAYILSQSRFRTCDETDVPLKYHMNFALLQPKQVMVKLEIRDDALKL